jgi:hypothetical protein
LSIAPIQLDKQLHTIQHRSKNKIKTGQDIMYSGKLDMKVTVKVHVYIYWNTNSLCALVNRIKIMVVTASQTIKPVIITNH